MKLVASTLLIIISGMLFAQKAKVGIVNRDSVLASIPGGSAVKDTVNAHKLHVTNTHDRLENELNRKIREADSLKEKSSLLIQQLRQVQIEQITDNLAQFDYLAAEELKIDSLKLVPFIYYIEQAEIRMVEKYHCGIESEYKNDSREPIYLTNEVIALLKENKTVQGPRKTIGYVNKDSILRIIYPEYRAAKEDFEHDIRLLNDTLTQIQDEYIRKENTIDSLKGTSNLKPSTMQRLQEDLDSIESRYKRTIDRATMRMDARDSVQCAPYNAKYDKVWSEIMKQGEFFYIYDSKDAVLAWKAEEADLINLNRDFATKLE